MSGIRKMSTGESEGVVERGCQTKKTVLHVLNLCLPSTISLNRMFRDM